jgi:hypothetical protein
MAALLHEIRARAMSAKFKEIGGEVYVDQADAMKASNKML